MGFMKSWAKGWSFIKAAFTMARENKKLLAPSLIQVAVTIAYFAAWVAAILVIQPGDSQGTWIAIGAIATFGSFLIFYFFCGMTVNMIDVHLKGGTPSLGDGAKDAGKNIVAISFLAVVSTIVDNLARAARDNNSIFGKIVASIVETVWTTLSFLLLPAIIVEDIGLRQAMTRVRQLHKGNMLLIGIGEVGVRGVTGLIGFIWCLLIVGVVYASFEIMSPTPALIASVTVGGTMFALYAAFATYLRMAYYTCLYLWAADVERQGAAAPAPLPLAIALGRAGARRAA